MVLCEFMLHIILFDGFLTTNLLIGFIDCIRQIVVLSWALCLSHQFPFEHVILFFFFCSDVIEACIYIILFFLNGIDVYSVLKVLCSWKIVNLLMFILFDMGLLLFITQHQLKIFLNELQYFQYSL